MEYITVIELEHVIIKKDEEGKITIEKKDEEDFNVNTKTIRK